MASASQALDLKKIDPAETVKMLARQREELASYLSLSLKKAGLHGSAFGDIGFQHGVHSHASNLARTDVLRVPCATGFTNVLDWRR